MSSQAQRRAARIERAEEAATDLIREASCFNDDGGNARDRMYARRSLLTHARRYARAMEILSRNRK